VIFLRIDPHVHCRDGFQNYKDTIKHVLQVCDAQGVTKIFDMPNTAPPIISEKDVVNRLKLVPEGMTDRYHLYIGGTSDEKQLKEAINIINKYKEVIGIKIFAGKSVGNLAIISEDDQKKVYKILADNHYTGVVALHCEKEQYIDNNLFDFKNPITHAQSRPKIAEIESIKDQIKFAKEANFKGTLHICHTSCAESVELVYNEKEINMTCAVTPHHIMWNDEMLKRPDGLIYKMNPPLRSKEDVDALRKCLLQDKVNWIETDHASHAVGEKLFSPYMSGYPTLYLYKEFVEIFLPKLGLSKEQINKLTYDNIIKVYNL